MGNSLKPILISGLVKGWSGFLWMLKILVPISLLTTVLAWSGWINGLDFILEPVMGVIGLPAVAALPLIAGLLTGVYGGIAAMAPLPLTVDQMTLLTIFLLISHNLIQEGVAQSKSGLSFVQATLFRLVTSFLTVIIVSWFMDHEAGASPLTHAPAVVPVPFFSMMNAWIHGTLKLSAKILVIIIALMIILEFMKNYNLIDRVVGVIVPILKAFGLGKGLDFSGSPHPYLG